MYNYYYIKCSKEHRADLELKTYTKRSEEWLQNYLDTRLGKDIEVYVEKAEGSLPKIKNVAPDKLVSYIKSIYGQPKVPKRNINGVLKDEIDNCTEFLYLITCGQITVEHLYYSENSGGITLIKGVPSEKTKCLQFLQCKETRYGTPYVSGKYTLEEIAQAVLGRKNALIIISRK